MSSQEHDIYRFDEFQLDPASRVLLRGGAEIPLYPKAFDVLIYLVTNSGKVITKEEIFNAVWPGSFVEEGNLARQVSSLRKALGDRSDCIVTIPGRGYQFSARVEGLSLPGISTASQTESVLVQRVRERTQVVIEESFPAAMPSPMRVSLRDRVSRRLAVWSVLGLVLVAGASTVLTIYFGKRFSKPPHLRKVLVADFANTTGDTTFDRTLKQALEIDLEQSPYLDVMSDGEALSTLHLMGKSDDSPITRDIAMELCERSNRQVLLMGSIARVGGEYLLTLEATDCAADRKLTGSMAEAGSKEKVLGALDSIVGRIRSGLGEPRGSLQSYQVPIQTATTVSLEALKSYSMGVDMQLHAKEETESLPFFQRAVELDRQFAMAYGAIANEYYNLNEHSLALQYYQKAFDLSGPVSAKEKLTLKAHYYAEARYDLQQGIDTYRQWANIYPEEWLPWANMANEYVEMGQYMQAIATGERALAMEPNQAKNYGVLVRAYRRANRFAEAKSIGLKAIQRQMDSTNLHGSLYQIAIAEHDSDARAREAHWAAEHAEGWYGVFFADVLAEECASEGRYRDAEEAFRRAWETAEREKMLESADDILLDQAFTELAFGQAAVARATLSRVRKLDPDAPDSPILQAQFRNSRPAEAFLESHGPDSNLGTLMSFVYLPRVRAALAMQRGRPLDAIDALEPVTPYDLIDYSVPFTRATAYMQVAKPALAIPEFQKIVSNPGIDPVSILSPLAHLGLARAYTQEGNKDESKAEFERFFAAWKDADSDLPMLQQARREYAQLH